MTRKKALQIMEEFGGYLWSDLTEAERRKLSQARRVLNP